MNRTCMRTGLIVAVLVLSCLPVSAQQQKPQQQKPQQKQQPSPTADAREVAALMTKPFTGDLDAMIKRRRIRVATPYSKTHYFIDKGVQRGVTYEAFRLFEDELNTRLKTKNMRVHVVFVPTSRDQLQAALIDGRADLVAASITVTDERRKIVDFSDATMTNIDELVVRSADTPALNTIDDLSGKTIFIRKPSIYTENLEKINAQLKAKNLPPAVVQVAPPTLEDEDILEMVNAGLTKITIVDSHIASFWTQMFPKIAVTNVKIATDGTLAIAMRKNSPKLLAEINGFVKRHGPKTVFGNMMVKRYLMNTQYAKSATNEADMKRFQEIANFFKRYGEQYNLDWLLMAAQGYQESGLKQDAKSQVGAIGVMQVMPATGAELKVGDINKVEPNIHAGVKYIRFMIDRYFEKEPMDRLNKGLFAFAAYNAGPGRVAQLRREAKTRGLDPNVWFNNVERVASERIGRETVTYVSNIFKYYVAYRLAIEANAGQGGPGS